MIVYAGKQFWNDFNNGDEALFQDANRPRDNDKFKIRPWLQSDKWKQREVNKNIYTKAAELVANATTNNVSAAYTVPDQCTIPVLSEHQRFWDPWCKVNKDGNIEIEEDGTYIIQAFTQFLLPSTPVEWYKYVEIVSLLKLKTWNYTWFKWRPFTLNQSRICGTWDQLVAWTIGWFKKWDVFNVWAVHTYSSAISMYQVLNVQRLA